MPHRSRALAAALASLLAAAPALAQPKRPAPDPSMELVKQAIAKSQAGDHLGAIDLYLQAYNLNPQHTLLSNVGAEYQAADKPVEALKYFCMYLDKDPTGTNATYATSKARALQIELGNKDVSDDDVCAPPRKAPPTPQGETTPGLTGTEGLGGPNDPKDTGGSSGGTLKLAGLVAGVVGLVGVGVGTYYGIKAQENSDILSNHDPMMMWQDNLRDIEEQGQQYEDRQILLTVAGGALAVTGAVLFIVGATREPSSEQLSVRPLATPESLGFAIGRGF